MVIATAALDYHNVYDNNHLLMKKARLRDPFLHSQLNNGAIEPKQLIGDALHQRVEAIDHEMCEPGDEDTFYVADLGEVYRQHLRWKKSLPRVRPFYGK
jgi:ornithine decarboxylase